MPPRGSLNVRLSTSRRSPNDFDTPSNTTTSEPRRWPGGMMISSDGSRASRCASATISS
jgi:hypothetical protein